MKNFLDFSNRVEPPKGRVTNRYLAVALLLVVALLAFGAPAAGADSKLSVDLALSKSKVAVGEHALLTVTVNGPSGFSEPVLPEVDGLDITFRGRSQSIEIINAQVKSSKKFTYVVVPRRTGEFAIGPAQIKRSGQTYESNAVNLSAKEAGEAQAAGETQAAGPQQSNVIVEASVNNANPYVGQQVTLLFRFARQTDARIRNAGYKMPDLPDFWSEGMENRQEYTQKIGDKEYVITEIGVPLFPITEGDITIGAITLNYDELIPSDRSRFESPFFKDPFGRSPFDDEFFKFFRADEVQKRTMYTKPIHIHVHPLPPEGRPKGFKGGVGSFSMTARLSNDEVKAGESVTLTLALSGEGNIRDVPDPELDIDGVKTYSDTPSIDVKNYNDTVVGEKTYKIALVPQRAGQISIPRVSVSYFDPKDGRYEAASSESLSLKVLPSEKETLVMAKSTEEERESERAGAAKHDILPIHERIGPVEGSRLQVWLRWLRPVAYPLPIVVYALCFVLVKHREKLRTDAAYRRQRFASRMADAHIEKAAQAMKQRRWDEVFTQCSRAVTEYLADKLNIPAGGLTPSDIESALSSRAVTEGLLRELIKFLEACDYGRFASSGRSPEAAREYIERTRRIIDRLEKEAIKR